MANNASFHRLVRRLFVSSTGLFAMSCLLIGGLGIWAHQHEKQHDSEALYFLSQFPLQSPNDSAIELDKILVSLELFPVLDRSAQDFKRMALWAEVPEYVKRQTHRREGPLDPLPDDIQAYLLTHSDTLTAAESYILSAVQPKWGINISDATNFEIQQPVWDGVVHLHRLMLIRSFMASEQGELAQSERSLQAAWHLNQAVAQRPDSLSQLAAIIQTNNHLAFLRHLDGLSPVWQHKITRDNYQTLMAQSLQYDGWILYKGYQNTFPGAVETRRATSFSSPLSMSYLRLSAVDMSQQLNHYYRSLSQHEPCAFDPKTIDASTAWWNEMVPLGIPRSVQQWQRSGETMLAAELTQLVLQAKSLAREQGTWPDSLPNLDSTVCDNAHWVYQIADDNSLEITFRGPTAWRNQSNSGSTLSFRAPAWESTASKNLKYNAVQSAGDTE